MPPDQDSPRDVLMEVTLLGSVARVAAVDSATGTEVTFQAPATTARADLQRLAVAKLAYALRRRS